MDYGTTILHDRKTEFTMGYVGRYGGGGFIISPHSFINDGLIEFIIYKRPLSMIEAATIKEMSRGGLQVYHETNECYRVKHVKLTNKDLLPDETKRICNFNVDGENLTFKDFMSFQVVPNAI